MYQFVQYSEVPLQLSSIRAVWNGTNVHNHPLTTPRSLVVVKINDYHLLKINELQLLINSSLGPVSTCEEQEPLSMTQNSQRTRPRKRKESTKEVIRTL